MFLIDETKEWRALYICITRKKINVCICVCMCVCVCGVLGEGKYACLCMYAWRPGIFFRSLPLYFSNLFLETGLTFFARLPDHQPPEICLSLPTPSTGVPNMCHLIAMLHRCWESEALRFEWQVLYWLLSPWPSFLCVIMTNIVFFMAEFVGRTFNFVSETSVSTLSSSSHSPKHIRLSEPLFLIFRRNLGADVETTYEETVKGSSPNQTPISYSLLL